MNFSLRANCALVAVLLTALLSVSTSQAQLKLPFRTQRNAAAGGAEGLMLNERSGPWLVMCASFSGDAGVRKAENLAEELRSRHGLKAYVFRHQFDHTQKLQSSAIPTWKIDESSASDHHIVQAKMEPATTASYQEVAVMVGDFPTIEDAQAQKTLRKIKTLSSDSMDASLTGAAESDLSAERIRQWRNHSENLPEGSTTGNGAFRAAFLLPNPLLPDEYFESQKLDDFVIGLNKRVKYSLLKNTGVYTVRVASFQGESTFNLGEIQEKEREMKWLRRNNKAVGSSKLAEASEKARLLTQEFRKFGVEAYEFHDRHESSVCVGSFDWIVREDGQGNKIQNPEVVDVILKYKGKVENLPGRPNSIVPNTFSSLADKKILCDAQPIPVLVPKVAKQSTGSRLLNRFR